MLKISTFNDEHFNISSRTDVETPLELILKSLNVVATTLS